MKEILVSGNVTKDFNRLGIKAKCTYGTFVSDYAIYEVSEEDFKTLCNELDNEDTWKDCGWRYSEGSNQGVTDYEFIIKGNKIKAWTREKDIEDSHNNIYEDLLTYLCEEMGCSAFRNVAALTTDLAKYNHMTLAELFKKYQG